jgi:hypothetical protein
MQGFTTVDKLLELNKNIKDKDKIQIGQNINLPQEPSVKSEVVSTGNVYKHAEHVTIKHFFGLIEDHGQQGYDITYNVVKNSFSDEAGNETVSYDYQVTDTRRTWTSSASNFGVYKFGLSTLAAGSFNLSIIFSTCGNINCCHDIIKLSSFFLMCLL